MVGRIFRLLLATSTACGAGAHAVADSPRHSGSTHMPPNQQPPRNHMQFAQLRRTLLMGQYAAYLDRWLVHFPPGHLVLCCFKSLILCEKTIRNPWTKINPANLQPFLGMW